MQEFQTFDTLSCNDTHGCDVKSAGGGGETFATEQSRRKILSLTSCSSGGEEACKGGREGWRL